MLNFVHAILFSYAALFPVLNPLGAAAIFLGLVGELTEQESNRLAYKVAMNTFLLLFAVLLIGMWILSLFGLTISIVQIAGGLVVVHIGWNLLNQPAQRRDVSGADSAKTKSRRDLADMAFFPLAMPITAGPGAMTVALTIGAHEMGKIATLPVLVAELGAIVGIILCALTVYICYAYADRISRKLGQAGTQVIVRLAAFINLCIGFQIVWHGIRGLMAQ